MTGGWSDHAVNCDSISQGALQQQPQKAASHSADGMERAESIWPEVTGADGGNMVDARGAGVDRMTLVHRRIVGKWVCQRAEPCPFSFGLPVMGKTVTSLIIWPL